MNARGNPNWIPGISGNPAGRKPGVLNHNWMNPRLWFRLLSDDCKQLPLAERVKIEFKALELLMSKVTAIPATPDESVANAMLQELEATESVSIDDTIPKPETPDEVPMAAYEDPPAVTVAGS